jgi:hypothetical protein
MYIYISIALVRPRLLARGRGVLKAVAQASALENIRCIGSGPSVGAPSFCFSLIYATDGSGVSVRYLGSKWARHLVLHRLREHIGGPCRVSRQRSRE